MKVLLFANTEWYLYNFRLALARELARRGAQVVMVSPPGPYGERLQKEGFRWIPIVMSRRGLNPWGEAGVIARLMRLYRAENPDLVHHFTIKPVAYGSLAAKLSAVPAVVNAVAGMGYVFSSTALLARALRPMVCAFLKHVLNGKSLRVIVQNPDDRATLTGSGLAQPGIVRLIRGSGVNTEAFKPRPAESNPVPRVLLATRLLWDKGVGDFIEAARLLKAAGVSAEFLLAGAPDPGNPRAIPRAQLEEWSEEGIVTLLGHVEHMPDLLRRADIVVLPTTYGEGVPRILIEAASSGLPIVTTSSPGCREIVQDGVNGFLTPPRNVPALATAIGRLIGDPELRERMGTSGRRKALAEFDERSVIEATLKVYEELLPVEELLPAPAMS